MFGNKLFDFDGNGEVDAVEFMIGSEEPEIDYNQEDFEIPDNAIDINPYDMDAQDYENWLDDLND